MQYDQSRCYFRAKVTWIANLSHRRAHRFGDRCRLPTQGTRICGAGYMGRQTRVCGREDIPLSINWDPLSQGDTWISGIRIVG
jgi:hypothetical protein